MVNASTQSCSSTAQLPQAYFSVENRVSLSQLQHSSAEAANSSLVQLSDMMLSAGGSDSSAAHTTIVPQSRHNSYSTVNAILTANTEQYRTRTKEKSEPKPALSVLQIPSGLEVEEDTC